VVARDPIIGIGRGRPQGEQDEDEILHWTDER
jgi:hypothetical protein